MHITFNLQFWEAIVAKQPSLLFLNFVLFFFHELRELTFFFSLFFRFFCLNYQFSGFPTFLEYFFPLYHPSFNTFSMNLVQKHHFYFLPILVFHKKSITCFSVTESKFKKISLLLNIIFSEY